MDVNLSLSFFAALLRTDEESLSYAIIRRRINGMTIRHPGLKVFGIDKYAFDLIEGQFISLNSAVLEKKVAIVKNSDGSWTFWDRDGHRVVYTPEDLRKVYTFRFVNPALYQ